jgi:hypothetical protein
MASDEHLSWIKDDLKTSKDRKLTTCFTWQEMELVLNRLAAEKSRADAAEAKCVQLNERAGDYFKTATEYQEQLAAERDLGQEALDATRRLIRTDDKEEFVSVGYNIGLRYVALQVEGEGRGKSGAD